jgi:hypothetical protein
MMRTMAVTVLLLSSVAAAAAPPAQPGEHEKSADSADKMICKRFAVTGSLVSSKKICKTKADWQRDRDELRSANALTPCAMQGESHSC